MAKAITRSRNPLCIGPRARFTVIHPNCIRIEDHPEGKFTDTPSLFASERKARSTKFSVVEKNGAVLIDTGAIQLTYRPGNQPLGPKNLSARIRHGKRWVNWKPGQTNQANLGGTAETLDTWTGPRPLSDGLLSRDGWYLLNDSNTPILTNGWVRSRPTSGNDWYLFGYGTDFRSAFQAFST
ncbi:MAG: hypothetical protein HQK55_16795, partial [Deltaproteobacteria bacterium]|nr:hypothetical protein [Deltaproteobacteria bacterium]